MAGEDQDQLRVPLMEEHVSIERREIETDHVRVRTVVDTHTVLVEETVRVGRLDVTRTPVEREVAQAPVPYHEGNTLVIPVVEERLVVEKRLFVVEELRVAGSPTKNPSASPYRFAGHRPSSSGRNPPPQQGVIDARST